MVIRGGERVISEIKKKKLSRRCCHQNSYVCRLPSSIWAYEELMTETPTDPFSGDSEVAPRENSGGGKSAQFSLVSTGRGPKDHHHKRKSREIGQARRLNEL
jgi:hypothetical protein